MSGVHSQVTAPGSAPHFENLSVPAADGAENCDNNCFQITVAQGVRFKGCQRSYAIMLVSK